jgi:hypothetical protein
MTSPHRTVFYSWQSDLPNPHNRHFIGEALEVAARAIRRDESIDVEPVIDRDTAGVAGSPNIGQAILTKIDHAAIFVCDVSFIGNVPERGPSVADRPAKLLPNPNVLLELGYAMKALTMDRIILINNLAYGPVEALPFDIRQNRVIKYHFDATTPDKVPVRKRLIGDLTLALRTIFEWEKTQAAAPPTQAERTLAEICRIVRERKRPEVTRDDLADFWHAEGLEDIDVSDLLDDLHNNQLIHSSETSYGDGVIRHFDLTFQGYLKWITTSPDADRIDALGDNIAAFLVDQDIQMRKTGASCFPSGEITSTMLAEREGADEFEIIYLLNLFDARDYISLHEGFGGRVEVLFINAGLRLRMKSLMKRE